jgi:hypothetical protein
VQQSFNSRRGQISREAVGNQPSHRGDRHGYIASRAQQAGFFRFRSVAPAAFRSSRHDRPNGMSLAPKEPAEGASRPNFKEAQQGREWTDRPQKSPG